jgi:diguanylate cyclase (GGDEF)-like protein
MASLAVYFLIIHKLVAVPLKTLTLNVSRLSTGEILSQVLTSRKNEFSLLEDTFVDMSKRNAYSKKITNVLTHTAIIFLSQHEGEFDDTMNRGLKLFCDALNLDAVSVWRNLHKSNELYISQVYRWNRESGGTTKPLHGLEDIAYSKFAPRWEWLLAEGKYINGPTRLLPEADMLKSFGIVSVFVEPLFINNTFWGFTVFADRRDERYFDDDSIDVMRSAAHLCINMVRRTEMENAIITAEKNTRELKIEADKDPLTGIYNRRFFDANMKRLINSLSRSGSLLSLLMIDIDFFKRYNDTYGHVEGDKCLKIIAQTLSKTITRADDFVARYGGEEFVIVLPNTDEPGAGLVADRLLDNIRNCNIPHEKNDAADCVTISIGATTGKVAHTHNTDDFVKKADEMLYKSKQGGRNRYSSGSF